MEQKWYETIRYSLIVVKVIMYMLNELLFNMWQPKTTSGYDYIHKILNEDPIHFQQLYRMYSSVFRKLCNIIREKTLLQDTRFICVEEMLASFLLIVGQNSQYCIVRKTFGRSHFATS